MARRSLFVALAALAAALAPAGAQAATPTVTSANFATPVTLSWTPDAVATQTLFRAPGTCSTPPMAGQTDIATSTAIPGFDTAFSDSPVDGAWCYYIQNDALGFGNTAQATVDTLPPVPTVGVAPVGGAPNFLRGAVTITGASTDAVSGVASNLTHFGAVGTCAAGPQTTAWDTIGFADGAYDVCNVATDNALHTATATATVVVDNTPPLGAVVTPAAGTVVGGATVALSTSAADATAGIRNVQWRWAGANAVLHNIGAAVLAAPWGRVWNTTTGGANQRPPDGPITVSAVVTDNAGNALTIATPAVVDNTAPDVRPVVTAPPAVAGSPTLSWTAAHDAVGITRYDVLRGPTVIGTVASIPGAPTFSFSDKSAPDQATSTYIVRAYDGANHFADSTAVSVLVDSRAVSAPRGVTAATPTAAAPVLNWQAPATFAVNHYDVYRDGLFVASTTGAPTTFTDASAAEGTHDYAVLARDAGCPSGRALELVQGRLRQDGPDERRRADCSGARNRPGQSGLARGGRRALGRRRLHRPPRERRDGAGRADAGSAVCAPAQPGCADAAAATGTWSYGVFARDAAGNVALIGTVSNVTVVDKHAAARADQADRHAPEGQEEVEEHHVHAALGQPDCGGPRPHRRRAQPQARSRSGLPTARPSTTASAPPPRSSCSQGRPATSPSTPTTTAATSRARRCARPCRWPR